MVWGAFGLLAGVALGILAAGAAASSTGVGSRLGIGALIIAAAAVLPAAGGAVAVWVGRALDRREPRGRLGALALGLPNLFLLPFGTALGLYSYWVLLNNHVRDVFAVNERR